MTRPPDFRSLQDAEATLISQRLRAARAALPMHEYEKGASLELMARDFLRSFLPGEVGLGTGFVVWRRKRNDKIEVETSGQLDIIMYDAMRSGPVADLGTAALYPIEGVFGYVEVKTTFRESTANLLLQSAALRSVRERLFTHAPEQSGVSGPNVPVGAVADFWYDAHERPEMLPLSYVFAFDYERDPPKRERADGDIRNHFVEQRGASNKGARLDGVLLGDRAFLRCWGDDPTNVLVSDTMPTATFKSWLMRDLASKFRIPLGWTVSPDGLWEPPGYVTE